MDYIYNNIGIYLLSLVSGIVSCAFIPPVTNKLIQYKCKKRGCDNSFKVSWSVKSVLLLGFVILSLFLSSVVFLKTTIPQLILIYMFTAIAIVCVIIDYQMRIIPNEMVLLVFTLGICLRLMTEGLYGLLSSLIALLIVLGIFIACMAIMKFILKISDGVGAGDIKVSAAIAVAVGYPNVFTFLFGLALAIVIYCVGGLFFKKLTMKSTFPMCGVIMAGFLFCLYEPLFLALLHN